MYRLMQWGTYRFAAGEADSGVVAPTVPIVGAAVVAPAVVVGAAAVAAAVVVGPAAGGVDAQPPLPSSQVSGGGARPRR